MSQIQIYFMSHFLDHLSSQHLYFLVFLKATLRFRNLCSIFIWMILHDLQLAHSANISTTSSAKPDTVVPAMAISRLPSYEVVESNLTDTPAPVVDKAKIIANVTESTKKPTELKVEFRDSSTESKIPSASVVNRSIPHYQPSSSTTRASYINIGEGKRKVPFSYSSNHEHSLESGFQPILPQLFIPDAIEKPYIATEGLVDANFKSSLPTKYEPYQSTGGFSNYPTYGEVQSVNYYDPLKYEVEKVHLTTYVTPTVKPMQRPVLLYKPRRKYPTKSHHQLLKAPAYDDHFEKNHFESDFDGLMSYENYHEHYNLFDKPTYK